MHQLVECVPNFSNGRDPAIYNAIADAIRSVHNSIRLLDLSADPDHNRTVITFVGAPADVEEAAFRAISTAARLIDLDNHQGEHPRMGATDVCPFIPIKNMTIKECVEMAHRLAKRIGDELGICIYLYGDAATRPEREKLADIRKGQYEKWKEEIGHEPAREPDYGPAVPAKWGATVIGVRPFLIAYNLYLNSDNVEIAEQIARAVRFTSGGLRYVQAKGFLVEGLAQVSMNLTNFDKTPIYRVQDMVKREAARYGLTVTKAELVGLIPQKALMETARYYLQLDEMQDSQVLEYRLLEEEESSDYTPHPFLDALAANKPTPGGGSAAALAGALAAALAQMVAGLTVGRKKYAAVQEQAEAVLSQAADLRAQLTAAIREDAAAYEAVMAAYRQQDVPEEIRATAVENATIGAGEVPLRVARLSHAVARLAQTITSIGNSNAATDAAAGALLAQTAVQIAAMNVRINVLNLQNQALAAQWQAELETLERDTAVIVEAAMSTARERGGF
ncbi:MAG TPA: glutamate formimidoyltransferase [Chloroflexota bacterium]|nr:glutamate formimidoyltransferase [Chloroflexota bacterium]